MRLTNWPMKDLRHAFLLDDWPVEGRVSGEYHLYGNYETPHGFGTVQVVDGVVGLVSLVVLQLIVAWASVKYRVSTLFSDERWCSRPMPPIRSVRARRKS